MALRPLDVAAVARLARIGLSAEEAALFQSQLGAVLEFANQLAEVDVSGVEAAAHGSPVFDVFREDAARASFTAEEALQNAPRSAKGLFLVPKVIE